ncbi:tripartite tricarboxylate transporter TctB family protein [Kibdelosporangium philippinense]|uniref:Tripartite tricarboxylate transporter TctB family protein n=1 Tax=Kibdelosporangium philippinense TaxID=211113 RepID=A0ABS8ZU65_9PSEU|nr:tripartite tricarboxylate transporter TctB family protein [Kibdelosporangium philippinense]MCE7011280.1 tripartite tricarboxylate transporter TctB family protein [Kibdelosporangium philippinense]
MTRAVAGVPPILLGLVALWFAADLDFGSLTNPGPGLWPVVVSVVLVAAGIAIIVEARPDTEGFTRGAITVVIAAVSLGVYAYLFELTGFEIPTILLLALWLKAFGQESWLVTGIVSVVATAAAYALFILGLRVPLPHLFVI